MEKYHIEKNTVQEAPVIPLYGRKICSERFPQLFSDPEAVRLCSMLDYDFSEKGKRMESTAGLFGALEVAQRQYDIGCEVRDYLKTHPGAAVVNPGCGLDDTFHKCDNGQCRGFNIDIWFGADGGYSFISTLAEDNRLALRSLENLEENIRARHRPIAVVTGHTGWTDDLDFVFRHRAEICKPFTRRYADPEAPYDGYIEDDDTEEKARTARLAKKKEGPSGGVQ